MYGGNGHFQYSKGNNSKTRKTKDTVNVFCMSSHKGNNSINRKTTVTVHVLCTSSYGV